jgi:hypothetical protein
MEQMSGGVSLQNEENVSLFKKNYEMYGDEEEDQEIMDSGFENN